MPILDAGLQGSVGDRCCHAYQSASPGPEFRPAVWQ